MSPIRHQKIAEDSWPQFTKENTREPGWYTPKPINSELYSVEEGSRSDFLQTLFVPPGEEILFSADPSIGFEGSLEIPGVALAPEMAKHAFISIKEIAKRFFNFVGQELEKANPL